ncbi:MAG: FAD-dependent oxidoreductase [Lentisphaeraceae bacterium]|nr:FAD-dependent oxidoreductase [Lentisphaeraceae bacterium]
MKRIFVLCLVIACLCSCTTAEDKKYDVVIYGGTSAAVTSAIQVKRMGKSVIIVSPDIHLGGLTTGGLGWTDSGKKHTIGGLSKEFYHRVYKEYKKPETWKFQKFEEYGNVGQGTKAMDDDDQTMMIFEPSIARKVINSWIAEEGIPVLKDEWLNRENGVVVKDGKIVSITTLSGKTFTGTIFIDGTYEGDLMAAAGISYHVGREGKEVYGEQWNGVQTGVLHHQHHFADKKVDPYVIPGDPKSGVIPRVNPHHPGEKHAGDKKVQAYCFRMCVTDYEPNRIPFPKPKNYDPKQYELLIRIFEAGFDPMYIFHKFDRIPNHKTDTNNHGPFSFDNIGMNWDYPEASYERRREIIEEHKTYQLGMLYFICTDPRVPKKLQDAMNKWGLPKDEYQDTNNWTPQLYIREARRMIGEYVMTELDCLKQRKTPNSVGMGSYTMDSHNVQRYITPEGYLQNEGDIGVHPKGAYSIAYGSIVPKKAECKNLMVPAAMSSSHIAYGSIRMEPVFMILGQSAATGAVMAIDAGIDVQDVPYDKLRARLLKDGQILVDPKAAPELKGYVLDEDDAKLTGTWKHGSQNARHMGRYVHDNNSNKGAAQATFKAKLPAKGKYEVVVHYSENPNRATNVPVVLKVNDKTKKFTLNQTEKKEEGFSLGVYDLSEAEVVISNENTDGYVIVDAVQFLKK